MQGRAQRRAQALGGRQILDCLREAVEPTLTDAPGQKRVLLARLSQNLLTTAHRNDRIVRRIGPLDLVEIDRQDLDAGRFARGDQIRQRTRAKFEDIGSLRGRETGGSQCLPRNERPGVFDFGRWEKGLSHWSALKLGD